MAETSPSPKKKIPRLMSPDEWTVKVKSARLRLTTDRKLGKVTPEFVIQIAALEIDTDETNRVAYKDQVDAARHRVVEDSEAGRTTPAWVIAVASMELGD
ncbi:hypothetical protein ACX801_08060 [Arthrobacter bambusae]